MGICIQRYADVRMSHQVLKCFGIDTGLRHIAAIGMSANMRRYLRQFLFINGISPIRRLITISEIFPMSFAKKTDYMSSHQVRKEEKAITNILKQETEIAIKLLLKIPLIISFPSARIMKIYYPCFSSVDMN